MDGSVARISTFPSNFFGSLKLSEDNFSSIKLSEDNFSLSKTFFTRVVSCVFSEFLGCFFISELLYFSVFDTFAPLSSVTVVNACLLLAWAVCSGTLVLLLSSIVVLSLTMSLLVASLLVASLLITFELLLSEILLTSVLSLSTIWTLSLLTAGLPSWGLLFLAILSPFIESA